MNRGTPPGIDQHDTTSDAHLYEHDPTYYYPDGNIVLLIEGVLFKLHASLILPVDSVAPMTGNGTQRYPLGVDNLPDRLTDSSDANPIILPRLTSKKFRNYLFARLGCIYDPEFRALFTDAESKKKHNKDLLLRFLDITEVAHRFGMNKFEEWALSQVELVLESMYDLAELSWDKDTLLRLRSYACVSGRTKLGLQVTNFIQYFISIWTAPDDRPTEKDLTPSNLNTCVQLFKDPNLPKEDPALFGCAFASILSLGHRSAVWTSGVTRSQRTALHIAQVQLTALDKELESLLWLVDSYPYQLLVWACDECGKDFLRLWGSSFQKCGDLRSDTPLKGVVSLARLPQHRQIFSSGCTLRSASHGTTLTPLEYSVSPFMDDAEDRARFSGPRFLALNLPGDTRIQARIRCTELEWPIGYLDYHIQLVYRELAKRYEEIVL